MPRNAIETAEPHFVLPAAELAPMLVELTKTAVEADALPHEVPLETAEEATRPEQALRSDELGPPSHFVCPACNGTLYEIDQGATVRFRCRVGHAYSQETMESAHGESLERALWAALRALEERSALMKKLATYARRRGHENIADMYEQRSDRVEHDVRAIHTLITAGTALDPVEQGGI